MSGTAPIPLAQARELVLSTATRLSVGRASARMPVGEAFGRTLAEDLAASGDVPLFACSAMDGYAVVAGPAGRTLRVIAESRAGAPAAIGLTDPGQAIRISTGAAVPAGANAVIRQEDTELSGQEVTLRAACPAEENIRGRGEDLRAGERVLRAGTRLGFRQLGAAVSAGAGELTVRTPPQAWVLCTGDELRPPGAVLAPGEIHNSNALSLSTLAQDAGATVTTGSTVGDSRPGTVAALSRALETADLLVVCGGVSVGPHDHVKAALAELGAEEVFWRVALRPGGPVWFGVRGDQLVFGLPGNPVSAVVTFLLIAAPAIAVLLGRYPHGPAPGMARLTTSVSRLPTRDQAVRVRLSDEVAGRMATPTGPQGSHLISSLLGADALALITAGPGSASAGESVEIIGLPA